ncbi:uncharacterized protein LOC114842115 [Betta splendens]|uniref:Uncharacterized protein LOC114842115 n=1 Tax=Betta splendens TaxID=158456 RepID=A0A6P7KLN4_BETSP|nr:uncharacterized protein LOC114842115 [Betta splendens]
MVKHRTSVRSTKHRVCVRRRTIGGATKVSVLRNVSHPPVTVDVTPVTTTSSLDEHSEAEPSSSCMSETAYTKAKKKELRAWDSLKEDMLRVSYESSAPSTNICALCKEHAEYRCLECSSTNMFCETCITKTHRNSLHLPEKWNKTLYVTSPLELALRLPGEHCSHAVYARDMKIFVNTGQLCSFSVTLCTCEPETCTLLRYGIWPATPERPQTAFSIALLELFHYLSMECQVSVEGFCNMLRWKNNLSLSEVNMLYRALVGESISQFRHHHFRCRSLSGLCPSFDDGTTCPVCPKSNGNLIVTMDANFGLVRKRSSGSSLVEPLHGNRMFVREEDVQEYLSSHPDGSKPNEDCSNFKAGNLLRSQKNQQKLDVTGVFGVSCRHEIPLVFLNMTQGERLAYPMYIIKELLTRNQGKNLNLHVIYDIACVLSSHMHKKAEAMQQGVSLAVPAFHVFGHKLQCQVLYSTRRLKGFGLTDGEGMERLWSFLRRFARITKEMSPSHRLDLLTEALLYYGRRKTADIEVQLHHRWEKAEKVANLAKEELAAVLKEAPASVSEHTVQRWMETENEVARLTVLKTKIADSVPKWKRVYVTTLIELQQLKSCDHDSAVADEKKWTGNCCQIV